MINFNIKLNFYLILFMMMITSCNKNSANDDRGYIVKVGEMAPDFEMTLTDGTKRKLSDLRDKVVMLQFTASWCGVCRLEMPFIEKEIWQVHKDKDFIVIGIDKDEKLEKVLKFIEDTGVTYPIALDPGSEIFHLFAREKAGVTRNVIIDKSGKIVFLTRLFERDEFDQMKARIAELLSE